MPVSNRFKVVAGSVSVAVALGAGTAIAGVGSEGSDDEGIALDDVVSVSEVDTSATPSIEATVATTLAELDDSLSSPFEGQEDPVVTLRDVESPDDGTEEVAQEQTDESPDALDESPEDVDDTAQDVDESPVSPDDSPESADDSPESPDDSPESPDDSPESPDDTP